MEDFNKIINSANKLIGEIATDPKSKTTVVRIKKNGYGTDIIIPANGEPLYKNFTYDTGAKVINEKEKQK